MSVFPVVKILLSAGVIFAVTELVKRSDRLGKVADHAWYTFWYVLPTLPMFLVFPVLVRWWGFYGALVAGALLTVVLFALLRWAGAHWGLRL